MRGVKSLIALVVVLAGLGGYVYFVESKQPAGEEAAAEKEKVFAVEADKIDEMTIAPRRASGRSCGRTERLADRGARELAADQAEVAGLTSNLASLEIQRVVDEKPADLKDYGLAEPGIEVTFKVGGTRSLADCSSATRRRRAATSTRSSATTRRCS